MAKKQQAESTIEQESPQPTTSDPWWEVQGGILPKMEIQAPTKEVAEFEWMQKMNTTRVHPTAKLLP